MNKMRIELRASTNVDLVNGQFFIREHIVNNSVKVYAVCDNIACFLGRVEDRTELFELVGPKVIAQTLFEIANEYEWDTFYDSLKTNGYVYYIGEDKYQAFALNFNK